jgi:NitT/TauT family transport system substrate-binding protein
VSLRGILPAIVLSLLAMAGGPAARAADLGAIKVGVLEFGTVNWELDVIKHHGLDAERGFTLEVQGFGSGQATNVALQGGAVDAVVDDYLWVSRQRAAGEMLSFVPYSSTVGALVVPPDSDIQSLADLAGKKVGVAGGPIDKSWLLLQGLAASRYGFDLAAESEPVFGAAPLLNE